MSFLGSMFLWGLPLALVPVIIHLLHRRRREVIRWGAMRFLLEATTRRRRVWRIEDLLLMLLRAAVVAALVFALARPLLRSAWFGASGARDVVLVLDTSMSMSRKDADAALFEEQIEDAGRLIGELRESDTLRVLLASTGAEWLAPVGIPMNAGAKDRVRLQLQELTPTLGSADMMLALQRAVEAESADERATRMITVMTDGQSHGWRSAAADGWRELAEEVKRRPQSTILNAVNVGDWSSAADNLSVDSLAASRVLVGPGERVVLAASISNAGDVPGETTLLSWEIEGESIGVTTVPGLRSGETTNVSLEHTFAVPGVYEVSCRLKRADDLTMDDVGRYIIEVIDTAPILVVDGNPSAGPIRTETGYLLAALGNYSSNRIRQWKPVFEPHVIEVSDLESEELSEYRCVILADVPSLSESEVERLKGYVQGGGGLWVVLGDQTDQGFFNEVLYADGAGVSPLPLEDRVGDDKDHERFGSLRPPSPNHPATKLLADTERLDIDQAQIYRRHRFVEEEGGDAVSVLLAMVEGEPVAVEKVSGRGRVIVQTVPLGVAWSNLPVCQSFVVMVHEWLWYMIEPTATAWNLNVGEIISLSRPAEAFSAEATVTTPRGTVIAISGQVRGDEHVYSYSNTLWPGDYTLALRDKEGGTQRFPFYVSRDPDESDLTPLSETELEVLSTAAGVSFVEEPLVRTRVADAPPPSEPLWPWLLAVLLAVMVIEVLLAGRITRRRQASPPRTALDMGTAGESTGRA